jgi:hypothetical protein
VRSDTAAHRPDTGERRDDGVRRSLIDPRIVRAELLRLRSSSAAVGEAERSMRVSPAMLTGEQE